MDISEIRRVNLKTLIKEAGSRQRFLEITGKSDAQISQLLSTGKNSRNIGSRLARYFEEQMGKERGWMDHLNVIASAKEREQLNGEQSSRDDDLFQALDDAGAIDWDGASDYPAATPLQPEAVYAGRLDAWDSETPLGPDEVELPLFREVELAAGSGATQVIENHGAKLRFARSTLKRAGVLPENAACAYVRGNSMEPMMPDGACIGINTADTEIRDGKIYAIDHDGMLRVKMLYRRPGGGIKVVSLNSDEHPPEEYDSEYVRQFIRIKGRVFWYSGLL